jgi:hypothetical protein
VIQVLGILTATARMAIVVALACCCLLTADYLMQNTPQAARARLSKENAAAVRTAQALYAASGCSTIDGQPPPDLSYLPHVDCACRTTYPESFSACE